MHDGCQALSAHDIRLQKCGTLIREMPGMAGSAGRGVKLIIAGGAVLCLSFWTTLALIDGTDQPVREIKLIEVPLTDDDGTPRVAHASSIRDLPLASAQPFG